MANFQDKVVFITGASSGIGAALAREFGRRGASLVLAARRLDRLEVLAKELEAGGARALAVKCDVTQDGELEKAAQAARRKFRKIDVVVANAGFGVVGRLEKLGLEDYRRQFETNVFGVLRTVYATLQDLKRSRGTLVLMSSVAGHLSLPEASPYSMSKFAVRALADALFAELSPQGIHVVLLSPGFIQTDLRLVDKRGVLREDLRDPIPEWLQMPADRAARKMAAAIGRKNRELILTVLGKAAAFLGDHFPCLTTHTMKIISRKMGRGREAKRKKRPGNGRKLSRWEE